MLISRKLLQDILIYSEFQAPIGTGSAYEESTSIVEQILLDIQISNDIILNSPTELEQLLRDYPKTPIPTAGKLLLQAIKSLGGCVNCPVIDKSCKCTSANDGIIVVLLDDIRFDPMYHSGTPLITAVSQNNSRIVETLLDQDTLDPAAQDNAAVKLAKSRGYSNILQLLNDDVRTHYISDIKHF